MDTFLPPIERPAGWMMKLAYFFTRKQFGKVLMPLKVHSARLPAAFGMFYGKISALDKKMLLPAETALLVRQQVARINVCAFCIDASRLAWIRKGMNSAKFDALDYATELTKEKSVRAETFERLSKFYSEREICEIVYLIASEHVYNLTNIGLNIHSDMLCDITKKPR